MADNNALILEAGIDLAGEIGFRNLTRDAVATRAGLSPPMVNRCWGTMDDLRNRIVLEAVRREILPILAQALIDKNPIASRAPRALREKAARSVIAG